MYLANYLTTAPVSVPGALLVFAVACTASLCLLDRSHRRARKVLLHAKVAVETQSSETLALLNGVVRHADGLITMDASGVIALFNPACSRIFGYTEAEASGQNIRFLIPEPDQGRQDEYGGSKASGDSDAFRQVEGLRKDGTRFPVEIMISGIMPEGRQAFCAVIRDITGRVESERKLVNYAAQIQDKSLDMAIAKEHAEEESRIKSDFITNVSHQVRSGMSGIIGMNNLLLSCSLKPEEKEYAKAVKRTAESLLQIINDILDLSKIGAGRIELDHNPFDLKRLCEEIFNVISFKANQKHIELLLRYKDGAPCRVKGDPGRLRQILLNLLSNAIRFTDKGHVLLSVWCWHSEGSKPIFHIEVEDTGAGIPADRIDTVFNRLNRAGAQSSGGLGLSICKELCRIMGGVIGVKSEAGTGSTFWFEVPLEEDTGKVEPLNAPAEALLAGFRALLVDSSEMARSVIASQLTPYGVKVQVASSGEQALRILEEGNTFDVAIIDFMLPGMDGVMFARVLKEKKYTNNIALLMVTSSPSRADMQQMSNLDFVGYFNKPVTESQLRDALSIIANARKVGMKIPVITQHTVSEPEEERECDVHRNLQFDKARILLAEDNTVSQTLTIAVLKKYGCQVVIAVNGDEVLQQLSQSDFDLVFMDCQMPVMDGFETTVLIRKLEEHQLRRKLPVIALTADTVKGIDRKCFASGMNDYITKPICQSAIERMLIKWIPKQKRVLTLPENEDKAGVMDVKVFTAFYDLMDKDSDHILARYIHTSRSQLEAIKSAFAQNDFTTLQQSARTLESSSRQIGAVKLSAVAADLQALSKVPLPEQKRLKAVIEQLAPVRMETEMFIEQKMRA